MAEDRNRFLKAFDVIRGREEKANLLEELNTFLEAVSKKEQALTEQEVANSQQEVLNKAPLKIYIG